MDDMHRDFGTTDWGFHIDSCLWFGSGSKQTEVKGKIVVSVSYISKIRV